MDKILQDYIMVQWPPYHAKAPPQSWLSKVQDLYPSASICKKSNK